VRGRLPKTAAPARKSLFRRLVNLPPIRKSLLGVYDQIFKWYYT
jgi:hypothetical protein